MEAKRLDLSEEMQRLLKTPFRKVRVDEPVQMDNVHLDGFIGYHVQHSSARGPMKRGMRYHLTLNLD